jgi:hypothetical protein
MAKKKSTNLSLPLDASAASTPLLVTVEDLAFYAIDKASPFNLALYPQTNSMAKIASLKLTELLLDKLGLSIMWTIINAGLPALGGSPVPPASASASKTAGDVYAAANKTVQGS